MAAHSASPAVDYSAHVPLALLLTTVSGLATAVGGVVIVACGEPSARKLGHMLSFASGVMLYISFADLLAESVADIGFLPANTAFALGAVFFMVVVELVPEPDPSRFVRQQQQPKDSKAAVTPGSSALAESKGHLLKLALVTAVGISVHNFPEGVAVYLACLKGPAVGLPLMVVIAAHNIPEGMAVAAPIFSATASKWQAIKWSTLSGIVEPAGALLVAVALNAFLTDYVVQCMLAGVGGIMVYMTVRELMPTTFKYISPEEASYSFLAGMTFIASTVYYLHSMHPAAPAHDHLHDAA
eukprot:m51a1_g1036 hypothetical protein (298) ;mRNA; f:691014-692651